MKSFNSKILLFGEYSLLRNSMGLAIPYSKYSGYLNMPGEDEILNRSQIESNAAIKKLAIDLIHRESFTAKYNVDQFLEDALTGLNFTSNIPKNYGLGSSGSLVAAIYHNYLSKQTIDLTSVASLKNLKSDLAEIESYFHGSSSGTDPLISFLNTPIIINAPANHFNFEMPGSLCFFLINTQTTSYTKDFIEIFNQKCSEKPDMLEKFIQLNNKCIAAFFEQSSDTFQIINEFSNMEQQFLPEMFKISDGLNAVLEQNKNEFSVKLCGSGGGGYLLGVTELDNFTAISRQLSEQNIEFYLIEAEKQQLINC